MNKALNGTQQTILDLFRIVAAMFVLFGHSFSFYEITVLKDQACFPYIQNIGVVVFFLLAGFLTAFSLSEKNRNHTYSFSSFFKHKTVRIAKEYLPGLLLILVIDYISIAVNKERYLFYDTYSPGHFFGNVFMLQEMGPYSVLGKWFMPFGSGRPLWTLSVEWWLYMLYGALFLFLSNKEKISLPKILVFCGIVFMVSDHLISVRGNGLGVVFLLGVLSYCFYDFLSLKAARILFPLSCLRYVYYGIMIKEAYTVCSFIIICVVFCSAVKIGGSMEPDTKRNEVFAFISKSTFMLYLVHYSIIDFIMNTEMNCSISVKFWLGIVLSLIMACCCYYVFAKKNIIAKANLINK